MLQFLEQRETLMSDPQLTVLYIEDNPENRLLVRRILQADGYFVQEAENAQIALSLITKKQPDLILMDINLPEIDGYTLTREIRKQSEYLKIPIIALTANVMKGDQERVLEAGCDGYIQKPIDVDLLPAQIAQYIKRGTA